ncbi:MAG TPA: hypothetical protein VLR52_02175 [Bacteroidales bacterium]|nr:hypothetical protein [Bacteroidales bacterium]
MEILKADFDNWHIEYIPDDGARIAALRYAGHDLLSSPPVSFRSPERFYGEYETRPVYGYDDCFPTVDPCLCPGGEYQYRDHGELCWRKWITKVNGNCLICSTDCLHPQVNFKRIRRFERNSLIWRFEVTSLSEDRSVFLHVMHALLPMNNITEIEVPEFTEILDEINSSEPGLKSSAEVGEYLLAFRPGSYGMLILKEINDGYVKLKFSNGFKFEIRFDMKLFPTLGIWWNNKGYPEGGLMRTECAFEPIPGTCSDLSKSFRDDVYLSVAPGEKLYWEVIWTIK